VYGGKMKNILLISLIIISGQLLFAFEHFKLDFNDAAEASGIIAGYINKDLLYTHNDSGGKPIIYILDYHGKKKGEWLLKGIKNRDWEEIAISQENGKSFIFIGDIGDNKAKHNYCSIYKFSEMQFDNNMPNTIIKNIQEIKYQYEDGPRDAEAFFIDPLTNDIIIISKREPNVGIYKISHPYSNKEMNIAKKICTLAGNWVVAADISKDGSKILIKNYLNIWLYERYLDEDLCKTFAKKPQLMEYQLEIQGEAVCWDYENKGYFTLSERVDEKDNQFLFYYKLKPNN
jgi:hypothetical protein